MIGAPNPRTWTVNTRIKQHGPEFNLIKVENCSCFSGDPAVLCSSGDWVGWFPLSEIENEIQTQTIGRAEMIRYCLGGYRSPTYLYSSEEYGGDRVEVGLKTQFSNGKPRETYVDILETLDTGALKLKVYWNDGSVEELFDHQAVWDNSTIRIVDTEDTYPEIPRKLYDGRFNS